MKPWDPMFRNAPSSSRLKLAFPALDAGHAALGPHLTICLSLPGLCSRFANVVVRFMLSWCVVVVAQPFS